MPHSGREQDSVPDDVSTPIVEIMMVKLHLSSVISTKGAKYIKDFYLNTPMEQP